MFLGMQHVVKEEPITLLCVFCLVVCLVLLLLLIASLS